VRKKRALIGAGVAVIAFLPVLAVTTFADAGTRWRPHHRWQPRPSASAAGTPTTAPNSPSPSTPTNPPTAKPTAAPQAPVPNGPAFFDDFSYTGPSDSKLASNGWYVRTERGAPGVSGAAWSGNAVSFAPDAASGGSSVMRLDAATNGTGAGSTQSEVSTRAKKFFTGTYAARVYFSDAPTSGPDGDQINQTFFTITPLGYDNDPTYSELDFEYLPNGGWGEQAATMFTTSYYTYANNPTWKADNASRATRGSLAGWHTLIIQVNDGTVTYLIDGKVVDSATGKYYPRQAMTMSFNHWFIEGGLLGNSTPRSYREQVDWVFHSAGANLTPEQVTSAVTGYRAAGTTFTDTVPATK
jgi:hypothetical protein